MNRYKWRKVVIDNIFYWFEVCSNLLKSVVRCQVFFYYLIVFGFGLFVRSGKNFVYIKINGICIKFYIEIIFMSGKNFVDGMCS